MISAEYLSRFDGAMTRTNGNLPMTPDQRWALGLE
jgi:hypothetical protein